MDDGSRADNVSRLTVQTFRLPRGPCFDQDQTSIMAPAPSQSAGKPFKSSFVCHAAWLKFGSSEEITDSFKVSVVLEPDTVGRISV